MTRHRPDPLKYAAGIHRAILAGTAIAINDKALAQLSPIGWEHDSLTGTYAMQAAGRLRKLIQAPANPLQPPTRVI